MFYRIADNLPQKLTLLDYLFGPLVAVSTASSRWTKSRTVCLVLGLLETGLRVSLILTFDNVTIGSFGIDACCVIVVIMDGRVYVRLFFSFALFAIALYGAINDGNDAVHFASISACATQHDISSDVKYYGRKSN